MFEIFLLIPHCDMVVQSAQKALFNVDYGQTWVNLGYTQKYLKYKYLNAYLI